MGDSMPRSSRYSMEDSKGDSTSDSTRDYTAHSARDSKGILLDILHPVPEEILWWILWGIL